MDQKLHFEIFHHRNHGHLNLYAYTFKNIVKNRN